MTKSMEHFCTNGPRKINFKIDAQLAKKQKAVFNCIDYVDW